MPKFILLLFFLISINNASYAQAPIPTIKPDATMVKSSRNQPSNITKLFRNADHEKPLSDREIGLYRDVFDLQKDEKWAQADVIIQKIDNPVLIGHVLAHRILSENYNPTTADMERWMVFYADHPQSRIIKTLINTDKPSQYISRTNGTLADLRYFSKGSKYISDKYKNGQGYELNLVKQEIAKNLDRGAVTTALNYFNKHRVQRYIDPIDKSQILAEIASYYLYLSQPKRARATALKALQASEKAPLAGWVMGLTSWINGDMVDATRYFTIASNAPYASPWMTSAASYWGARAATRGKLFQDVSPLLAKAVKNQRTFYGLIATKAMGYGYDFNWTMPQYSSRHRDKLMTSAAGARAIALSRANRLAEAEDELFALSTRQDKNMGEAAIAFSNHYNLAGYAMRFSLANNNPAGGYYDAGLFPISSWTTTDGVDTPMLNAFIRQESRFRTNALNQTGATGLMQIMPATAAYITGNDNFKKPSARDTLSNPINNVRIGARYLNHLRELNSVNNDLFSLAIAYNAGPGKLSRWKRDL